MKGIREDGRWKGSVSIFSLKLRIERTKGLERMDEWMGEEEGR